MCESRCLVLRVWLWDFRRREGGRENTRRMLLGAIVRACIVRTAVGKIGVVRLVSRLKSSLSSPPRHFPIKCPGFPLSATTEKEIAKKETA